MANLKTGWSCYFDADGKIQPAIDHPGAFIVKRNGDETWEAAEARIRAGGGVRMSQSQIRKLTALFLSRIVPGFAGVALSAKSIKLTWNSLGGAKDYEVQSSPDGTTWGASQVVTGLTLTLLDLLASTVYFYRIRGKNKQGTPISPWQTISLTTLLGLEKPVGTILTTPMPAISAIGYNGTVGFDVFNLLITASEPIEAQVGYDDDLIQGTILGTNAGKFNPVADPWLGYGGRIRLDRTVTGVGGVESGRAMSVLFRAVADRSKTYLYTFAPMPVVNTAAVGLPLAGTESGAVRWQLFGTYTANRDIVDTEEPDPEPTPTGRFTKYDYDNKNWWGFRFYSADVNAQGGMPAGEKRILAHGAKPGKSFNYVFFTQQRQFLEKTPNAYDFTLLDDQMASANLHNYPFALCLSTGWNTNNGNPDNYIAPADAMRTEAGDMSIEADNRIYSYCAPKLKEKAEQMIRAVLTHIKNSPHRTKLKALSLVNKGLIEAEYPQDSRQPDGSYPKLLSGYDEWSRKKFVERLQAEFGGSTTAALTAMNDRMAAGDGQYVRATSWDALLLPILPRTVENHWYATTPYHVRFQRHRELCLIEFGNWWHDLVKSIDANITTMIEFGSNGADNISSGRGTLCVTPYLKHDIIKSNSQAAYVIQLPAANGLRDYGPGRYAADELERTVQDPDATPDPIYISANEQINWVRRAYTGGCRLVDWANMLIPGTSTEEQYQLAEQRINEVDAGVKLLLGNVTPRTYQFEVEVSFKELYHRRNMQDGQRGESYQDEFVRKSENFTKRGRFVFVDDHKN